MVRSPPHRRLRRGGWPLLLPAVWLAGCGQPPLRVEYSGCSYVREGPVCVHAKDGILKLWIEAPTTAPIRLEVDGQPLESRGMPVQGGLRFVLEEVPVIPSELSVSEAIEGGRRSWKLRLETMPPDPDWYPQVSDLYSSNHPEDTPKLAAVLEPIMRSSAAAERAEALMLMGTRLRKSDPERAVERLAEAVRTRREAGQLRHEIRDAGTLAWVYLQQRRIREARALLDGLSISADLPSDALFAVDFYRGLLADKIGDSRSALHHLRSASARAERLGLTAEQRDSDQVLAWHLQSLGRSREAAEIFQRLHSVAGLKACERAQLLTNQAWSLLLVLEAGDPTGEDPAPLLRAAIELFSKPENDGDSRSGVGCDPAGERRRNALVNLALAHLHAGRLAEARQALAEGGKADDRSTVLERLWILEIEARLQLAEGRDDEALEAYERIALLAAGASVPEARWRAAVGRGRALLTIDQPAATAALAEAEELLDEESLQVPIHDGRESFVAQRHAGTRLYLELLLRQHRIEEAFAVTRRARGRILRAVQRSDRLSQLGPRERALWDQGMVDYSELRQQLLEEAAEDWQLSVEELERARARRRQSRERLGRILDRAFAVLDDGRHLDTLPEPTAGDLVLAYHPLDGGDWVGFAADGESVRARRIVDLEEVLERPAELAGRVLDPFTAEIDAAKRLRILPYGSLRGVEFHALPYGGDLLVAHKDVVYGIDVLLPPSPAPAGPLRALVVADPRSDLPAAREESEAVRKNLSARPNWDVRTLAGGQADGDAVRRALSAADLLHYAGHGGSPGRGGWQSALYLAGSRLTLGDVLTLEAAPRWVVLSACEAARSDLDVPVETLALAQAFVTAGSRQVVAATRPVDDRFAAEMVRTLYRQWDGSGDLATALRQAQLERRQADPRGDWAGFRVLEP